MSGGNYIPAGKCPNNLRKFRELKGLSMKELADLAGVDPNTISQYETGASEVLLRRRTQLGLIFNLPADDFLPKWIAGIPEKSDGEQPALNLDALSGAELVAIGLRVNEIVVGMNSLRTELRGIKKLMEDDINRRMERQNL